MKNDKILKYIENKCPFIDDEEKIELLETLILNETDTIPFKGKNFQGNQERFVPTPLSGEEMEYMQYTRPKNLKPPTPEEMKYIQQLATNAEDTDVSTDVGESGYFERGLNLRKGLRQIPKEDIQQMFDIMKKRGVPQTDNFDWSKDPEQISSLPVYGISDQRAKINLLKRMPEIVDYVHTYGIPKEYADDPWVNMFFWHNPSNIVSGAASAVKYNPTSSESKRNDAFFRRSNNGVYLGDDYIDPNDDTEKVGEHEKAHAYGDENAAEFWRNYVLAGMPKGKISPRKFFSLAARDLYHFDNDTRDPGLEQSQINAAIKNLQEKLVDLPPKSPERAKVAQDIEILKNASPIRVDKLPLRFQFWRSKKRYPIYSSQVRDIRDASGSLHNLDKSEDEDYWAHPSLLDTLVTNAPRLARGFDSNGIYKRSGLPLADELRLRRIAQRKLRDAMLLAKRKRQQAYRKLRDRPSQYTAQNNQLQMPYGSLGGPMSEGVKRYKLKKKVNN